MVALSNEGRVKSPIYTWADTRASAEANFLKQTFDVDALHAITGTPLHPCFFPSKLMWLKNLGLRPEDYLWVSPGEFMFRQFFGDGTLSRCSHSMASATGLYNQQSGNWDLHFVEALGFPDSILAQLTDIDTASRGLIQEWAERWPCLKDIPWLPAIGDGAASNLGSGCATEKSIAINLGTSGAIRTLVSSVSVEIPDDLWCYRLDQDYSIYGGAFSDGGDLLTWMRDRLAIADIESLLRQVASIAPDSHGLTLLPFVGGERSVGWNADRRGSIHGLSMNTSVIDIVRAAIEAVALRFALVHRSLDKKFPNVETIVAAGGAFQRAPFWAQIISDCINRPITLADEMEATSRGAAMVALKYLNVVKSFQELKPLKGQTCCPSLINHEIYASALERQEDIYRRLD